MTLRIAALAMIFALLTGCAATVQKTSTEQTRPQIPRTSSAKLVLSMDGAPASVNATDWNEFKLEWKANFVEQARLAGVAFEMQDGQPRPTGEEGTLLHVYVNEYRFIRPGTRYGLGVMTGNAYIKSKLTFSNLKNGEVFGTHGADTTSSAMQGTFAPMTNKQVEAIAAEVFKQLKSSRPVN